MEGGQGREGAGAGGQQGQCRSAPQEKERQSLGPGRQVWGTVTGVPGAPKPDVGSLPGDQCPPHPPALVPPVHTARLRPVPARLPLPAPPDRELACRTHKGRSPTGEARSGRGHTDRPSGGTTYGRWPPRGQDVRGRGSGRPAKAIGQEKKPKKYRFGRKDRPVITHRKWQVDTENQRDQ